MTFESLKNDSHDSTNRLLDRVEGRVEKGVAESAEVDRTFGIVENAMKEARAMVDAKLQTQIGGVDFALTEQGQEWLRTLSDPWEAWNANGTFAGAENAQTRASLQSILQPEKENLKISRARRYARQVWRTEMTEYILKKVQNKTSADDIMIAVLDTQKVTKKESSPKGALITAMSLGYNLSSRENRAQIAAGMKASTVEGNIMETIEELGLTEQLDASVKVVVGGEFIEFPVGTNAKFLLKNVFLDREHGLIYAQMKNGCEGNLVVIEIPDPDPRFVVTPNPQPMLERDPDPEPAPTVQSGVEARVSYQLEDPPPPPPQEGATLRAFIQEAEDPPVGPESTPDFEEGVHRTYDKSQKLNLKWEPEVEKLKAELGVPAETIVTACDGGERSKIEIKKQTADGEDDLDNGIATVYKVEGGWRLNVSAPYYPLPIYSNAKNALADALLVREIELAVKGKTPNRFSKKTPYTVDPDGAIEFNAEGEVFDPRFRRKVKHNDVSLEDLCTVLNKRYHYSQHTDEIRGGDWPEFKDIAQKLNVKAISFKEDVVYNQTAVEGKILVVEEVLMEAKRHPSVTSLLAKTTVIIDKKGQKKISERNGEAAMVFIRPTEQTKDEMVQSILAGLEELYPEEFLAAPSSPEHQPQAQLSEGITEAAGLQKHLKEIAKELDAGGQSILPGDRYTTAYFYVKVRSNTGSEVKFSVDREKIKNDVNAKAGWIYDSGIEASCTLRETLANAFFINAVEEKMHGKTPAEDSRHSPYEVTLLGAIDFDEAWSPLDPDLAPGKNKTSTPLEEIRDTLNLRIRRRRSDEICDLIEQEIGEGSQGMLFKSIKIIINQDVEGNENHFLSATDETKINALIEAVKEIYAEANEEQKTYMQSLDIQINIKPDGHLQMINETIYISTGTVGTKESTKEQIKEFIREPVLSPPPPSEYHSSESQ
jgi:hypothetical protein